jgi:hypothetical protein
MEVSARKHLLYTTHKSKGFSDLKFKLSYEHHPAATVTVGWALMNISIYIFYEIIQQEEDEEEEKCT